MAFTEKQEYKIEILPNGTLQIRRADIVLKDDVEIGRQYHRHVLQPGADVTNEVQRVQDVAAATWTTDVVSAYQATLPDPEPVTEPDPLNLIPDNWSQEQRLAAMQELLDEYNANQ